MLASNQHKHKSKWPCILFINQVMERRCTDPKQYSIPNFVQFCPYTVYMAYREISTMRNDCWNPFSVVFIHVLIDCYTDLVGKRETLISFEGALKQSNVIMDCSLDEHQGRLWGTVNLLVTLMTSVFRTTIDLVAWHHKTFVLYCDPCPDLSCQLRFYLLNFKYKSNELYGVCVREAASCYESKPWSYGPLLIQS